VIKITEKGLNVLHTGVPENVYGLEFEMLAKLDLWGETSLSELTKALNQNEYRVYSMLQKLKRKKYVTEN
jgi:hypothetical protein